MSDNDLVSVTFTSSASPYSNGDVAGFLPEQAEIYIKAGVAKLTPQDVLDCAEQEDANQRAVSLPTAASRTRKSGKVHADDAPLDDGVAGKPAADAPDAAAE